MTNGNTAGNAFNPLCGTFGWILRLFAIGAAVVSGYLFVVSLQNRGLPPGCGAGSGCADVLTSRWSQLWGIPVSGPALIVDLALFAASFLVTPTRSAATRIAGWATITTAATAILTAAVWFTGLQLFVIHAFCRWCMAAHVLGGVAAAMALWRTPRMSATPYASLEYEDDDVYGVAIARPPSLRGFYFAGFVAVTAFAMLQMFADSHQPAAVQRLEAGENSDTGPGPDRTISILNGTLEIKPHEVPMLGSPDAPHLLVLLFDYRCPHCRATHQYLVDGLKTYDQQYGVILMPTPLNSKCNPHWEHTEERFEPSCDIARLALAVWRQAPLSYRTFAAYLFEDETPPSLEDARLFADIFIGQRDLGLAAHESWIDRYIKIGTEAFHESRAERVPVILSPSFDTIVGLPESERELFSILEQELDLASPSGKLQP